MQICVNPKYFYDHHASVRCPIFHFRLPKAKITAPAVNYDSKFARPTADRRDLDTGARPAPSSVVLHRLPDREMKNHFTIGQAM